MVVPFIKTYLVPCAGHREKIKEMRPLTLRNLQARKDVNR